VKLLSLTTLRELFRLSLPMVVSQGSFAVMVFTDRWFMSMIDATHIAAAMGGGVASYFCLSLFMGVITYANPLVAQYYGAGELEKCPRVVTQGLMMAVGSVPLLLAAAWLFTLVKACLACYFSGIGRTRVVMIADVLGVSLNIPLSWALIFGAFGLPQMGLAGAGLGTVIASVFAIGIYLVFYLNSDHQRQFHVARSLRFDRGITRRYLRLGTPSGLENFMNTATFNLFLLMFQSYGVVQGAAMAIVFNWDMLSFIPMIGLNIGVMSLIGRFVGASDMARANQVISSGFILAFSYSGVLVILFLAFRMELVDVFRTPDAEFEAIRVLAGQMMIGLVTYMMADATILISGGALRGAGDTRWIMVTSISVHWAMLVAQYFVIVVYGFGPLASWWVFVVMLLTLALLYLRRLLGDRWRRPEILAKVMAE
jgi:MATE family multidrug resistance protein